jgi:hypothetical protein
LGLLKTRLSEKKTKPLPGQPFLDKGFLEVFPDAAGLKIKGRAA